MIVVLCQRFAINKAWYSGALLKDKSNTFILITVKGSDLHIQVKSQSKQKFDVHGYLKMIHDQLSLINNVQGAVADELVVYHVDNKEVVFFYDDLVGSIRTGIQHIYSRVLNKRLLVRDILKYSNYDLVQQSKELLFTIATALEKLQDNIVYYELKEDYRTTYVRDMIEMHGYICKDQNRGGCSRTGREQGQRDILICDKKDRISDFKTVTKTRRSVHLTMITTYGLKRNAYSAHVQSVVTAEDLFQPEDL